MQRFRGTFGLTRRHMILGYLHRGLGHEVSGRATHNGPVAASLLQRAQPIHDKAS
ncbi:hypothetical protein BH09ACT12_BH09ACT12_01770 [soil metagenome]